MIGTVILRWEACFVISGWLCAVCLLGVFPYNRNSIYHHQMFQWMWDYPREDESHIFKKSVILLYYPFLSCSSKPDQDISLLHLIPNVWFENLLTNIAQWLIMFLLLIIVILMFFIPVTHLVLFYENRLKDNHLVIPSVLQGLNALVRIYYQWYIRTVVHFVKFPGSKWQWQSFGVFRVFLYLSPPPTPIFSFSLDFDFFLFFLVYISFFLSL